MAVSTQKKGDVTPRANKMTPEIYFARKLACNEKKIRDKTLKKLKRWLTARSAVPNAFTDDELLKLWKGLFYCMWMSDKPLIQEEVAETIASLVYSITDRALGLKFVSVALRTMARDWSGIDNWRMDKFMMFVRRIIRHSLEYLAMGDWKEEEVASYSKMLSDVINANTNTATIVVPIGLQLHITSLFPEELAKAGAEELSTETILKMLEPFVSYLATGKDDRLKKDIRRYVFVQLIKQSDEGIEYEEAGGDKRQLRPPKSGKPKKRDISGDDEVHQPVDDEVHQPVDDERNGQGESAADDEELGRDLDEDAMEMEASNVEWGAKDPRAGGVDVVVPQLKPDWDKVADWLMKFGSANNVRTKDRKSIYLLVKWFRNLSAGVYPLVPNFPVVGEGLTPKMMKGAVKRFISDQHKMSEVIVMENDQHKSSTTKRKADQRHAAQQSKKDDAGGDDDEEDDEDEEGEDEEGDEECDDEEGIDLETESEGLDEEEEDLGEDLDDFIESDSDDDDDSEEESLDDDVEEEEAEFTDPEDANQSDTSEDEVVSVKKTKKAAKRPLSKPVKALATFEVEDNWEEEKKSETASVHTSASAIQQLKRKLKAGKRTAIGNWKETSLREEVEIVVPNKKYKGAETMTTTPSADQSTAESSTPSKGRSRRVSFVLAKNTAQAPRDYEESLRKSPGVPHDPDRKPSGGGVLKRSSSNGARLPAKVAPSPENKTGHKAARKAARNKRLFNQK